MMKTIVYSKRDYYTSPEEFFKCGGIAKIYTIHDHKDFDESRSLAPSGDLVAVVSSIEELRLYTNSEYFRFELYKCNIPYEILRFTEDNPKKSYILDSIRSRIN